jgi:3-hydroxyisobutyrate dehydrogenase-like beta-hydroxyacid dehydrogenase
MELSVGVVGLGPMGAALASALIAAGHELTVWDRDAEKVATTAMIGASTAVSAAQVAAESDVVFTALPDPRAVLDVALGADTGILSGLGEGGVLIDMTTATPDVAQTLNDAFGAAGRRFIDAPVSGKAPKMSILLGATPAEVDDDIVELLSDVASSIVYCGVRGSGYVAKLVNQHIKYAWYLASAEALLIAKRYGLDAQTTVDAVKASSGSTRGFDDAAAYFLNDTGAVSKHAPVSTIAKDMRLAAELADSVGVDSPSLAVVREFLTEAEDGDYAHAPFPASIALLETLRVTAEAAAESTGRP